jgi:uncharacterized secreted repeat protein (TIGR03808 family)
MGQSIGMILGSRDSRSAREDKLAIDRRSLIGLSAAGVAAPLIPAPSRAAASPLVSLGVDVTHFGVHPGSPDDQSREFQQAIDAAAAARVPLCVPPGVYMVSDLVLPTGAQLIGVRGASLLLLGHGASIVASSHADQVTLQNLVFDGAGRSLPERHGLISLRETRGLRILDCTVQASGGNGIALEGVAGEISGTTILGAMKAAIFSLDARGLSIVGNTILNASNNGILVWRTKSGDDGTQILANRIEEVAARDGGSGNNGNGINVFRAASVIVADNRIKGCAFSAVRGNAASNLQVRGNAATSLGEIAFSAEFGFEGAVIAGNTVDGAASGISISNFDHGGRLAVCQGNLVRNLTRGYPKHRRGIGIAVEADSAVTGNVIEGAPMAGILVGSGKYLRDVTVTGNVVRTSPIGIAISVAPGAGSALVADNLIAGATTGAVIGMEDGKAVTGDLAREDGSRFAQLTITGNRVR